MKKVLTTLAAGVLLSGLGQFGAIAQILDDNNLVQYSVTTSDDSHPSNPSARGVLPAQQSDVNALLAPATSATLGSGASPNNYPFGLSLYTSYFSGGVPISLSNAIANNFYLGFTITPATGTALDLTDLDLGALEIESTDGNSAQTYQYDVLSSVGGFTSTASLNTVPFANTGTLGNDIQLGSAFSNLTTATSFRIYISGINEPDGFQTVNINDGSIIDLNGFVDVPTIIPEPGTYALLGLGGAVLMMAVRRRRSLNA